MAEEAFVKNLLSTISSQPVVYGDDYQQPAHNSLKRVPVLPLDVPPPPERRQAAPIASSSSSISVTFKSTKPPLSFSLTVTPADSISSIKNQVAAQAGAPPAIAQRLLLKGKALADGKLLQEYNVKDGDTVNLMVKPGFSWDPNSPSSSTNELSPTVTDPTALSPNSISPAPSRSASPNPSKKHTRIPSVVLSPSPSSENLALKPADITLDLEPTPSTMAPEMLSTYHATVSKPEFWKGLLTYLRSQFPDEHDALHGFEDFLRTSKSFLTAHEIAKIRDLVGVVGMSGT
jgi:hypothetical protein